MRVDLVVANPESYKSGFWATVMPVIVEYERRFAEAVATVIGST
jgi:hypothetical protein